jgi:hypothetical protein
MSGMMIWRKKMIDVDAIIEIHVNELIKPVTEPIMPAPSDDLATHRGPGDALYVILKRRRGRPYASESRNERTKDSYYAAVFVIGEMNRFRAREGTSRVPALITYALIDLAIELWPDAVEGRILEYIRRNRRLRKK